MSRYIDAENIGLTNFEIFTCNGDYKEALKLLLLKIENAPSADVVERPHGEWIIQNGMVVCSECFEPNFETNYCPNCGARMDERREDAT